MHSIELYFKEVFSFLVRLTLISAVIRELLFRNKATIIFYHDIKPDVFKLHLGYLTRHYNIISLDYLVSALRDKQKWKIFPKKPLVITMDDGFSGNYNLIPVLDEFKIPITIYVRPDGIFSDSHSDNTKKKYLNKKEILELSKHGVSFGAHSMSHFCLSRLSDSDSRYEIIGSKEYLEKELSIQIKHFAYPYGDYSEREIRVLEDVSDYISARTVKPGWIDKKTNPYELKCMGVGDNAGINKMILDAAGIFPFLRIVRSKFFSIRFNKYKTPVTYITGILNLRGPIAQHTERQAELIKKYAKGKKRLVEIGVSEGGSALVALGVMHPRGKMWLIDPYRSTFYPFFSLSLKIVKCLLAKFKNRDVTLIKDYSYNVARTWHTKIDYLLIDACHSEQDFMIDWKMWSPFVAHKGVILLQSIQSTCGFETGAGKIIKQLLKNTNFEWKVIDEADATLVIKRKQ